MILTSRWHDLKDILKNRYITIIIKKFDVQKVFLKNIKYIDIKKFFHYKYQ